MVVAIVTELRDDDGNLLMEVYQQKRTFIVQQQQRRCVIETHYIDQLDWWLSWLWRKKVLVYKDPAGETLAEMKAIPGSGRLSHLITTRDGSEYHLLEWLMTPSRSAEWKFIGPIARERNSPDEMLLYVSDLQFGGVQHTGQLNVATACPHTEILTAFILKTMHAMEGRNTHADSVSAGG
jgi:hypothetical protein